MGLFDGLRAEVRDKLKPQSMRLLCGEMSAQEMRTAKALMNWVLRMCDRYEPQAQAVPDSGLNPELAAAIARSCISKARQSHPDALSSTALHSVEKEIAAAFTPEMVKAHLQARQKPPESVREHQHA